MRERERESEREKGRGYCCQTTISSSLCAERDVQVVSERAALLRDAIPGTGLHAAHTLPQQQESQDARELVSLCVSLYQFVLSCISWVFDLLQVDRRTMCTDSFMLNLCVIMQKLCIKIKISTVRIATF